MLYIVSLYLSLLIARQDFRETRSPVLLVLVEQSIQQQGYVVVVVLILLRLCCCCSIDFVVVVVVVLIARQALDQVVQATLFLQNLDCH